MAIYHCNISVASRADGASAVAGAAYLSRSKLTNERDGITHDFTRAHQHEELVADLGVTLPEAAPERWYDRSVLWNEVEKVEKKADAQLARRIECALPDELSEAEQIELARIIVSDRVADGHVVDACIHRNINGTNAHLHMLEPLRSCDAEGLLAKSENIYTVRNAAGDERKANAADFKELKEQGFEKVYKWRRGNEWRELTVTEAARPENEGFKRHGRNAVQEARYFNNWNEKERAEEWREAIAKRTNEALSQAGKVARVDHRSYERQGVEKLPQLHEGSRVCAIEQKAREIAKEQGHEYTAVTCRRKENITRVETGKILSAAYAMRNSLSEQIAAVRSGVTSALNQLASEMDNWHKRMENAIKIHRKPYKIPSRAQVEKTMSIYRRQANTRLRQHRARLLNPQYRKGLFGVRDLRPDELAFLTPSQQKEYEEQREIEKQKAAVSVNKSKPQSQSYTPQRPPTQSHSTPSRGMSR